MLTLDIITVVIFLVTVIICTLRGFIKVFLRAGALAVSVIAAKIFGAKLGNSIFPEIIRNSKGTIPAEKLADINSALSSVIGTVLIFIVIYIVLRLIAGLLSKILSAGAGTKAVDRILGAFLGLLVGTALVFAFAEGVKLFAAAATCIKPESNILDTVNSTLILKFFL